MDTSLPDVQATSSSQILDDGSAAGSLHVDMHRVCIVYCHKEKGSGIIGGGGEGDEEYEGPGEGGGKGEEVMR